MTNTAPAAGHAQDRERPAAPPALRLTPAISRGGETLPPHSSELGLPPALAEGDLAERAVAAIRAEIEAAAVVEHRSVTLIGLIDRFGTRYLERATLELSAAVEELRASGERRAGAVRRVAEALGLRADATLAELVEAAPQPLSSVLAGLRAKLNASKRRIARHAERNTELLGRRMAIIAEAMSGYPDGLPPTYGRPVPTAPRLVKGVL